MVNLGLFRFTPRRTFEEGNAFQKFLFYVMMELHKRQYRKYKEYLYRPIFNATGHFTNAWRLVKSRKEDLGTIEEFCWSCVDPDIQNNIFSQMSTNERLPKSVATFLTCFKSTYLPDLERDRHLLSFRNGTYHINEDRFYAHDDKSNPFTHGIQKVAIDATVQKISAPGGIWDSSKGDSMQLKPLYTILDNRRASANYFDQVR